jgi:hypothetical protein
MIEAFGWLKIPNIAQFGRALSESPRLWHMINPFQKPVKTPNRNLIIFVWTAIVINHYIFQHEFLRAYTEDILIRMYSLSSIKYIPIQKKGTDLVAVPF